MLIFILISTSIICMFTVSNNQNYFITFPFINEESNLIFELYEQPKDIFFSFKSSGASVFEKIDSFCVSKACSIPVIIGGQVIIEIIRKRQVIFSDLFQLQHGQMNCTNEPWTNRICTFRNICYEKDDTFSFESPYEIQFESEFLCLGSKTPPVDLEVNRISSSKFKTVQKFNKIIQQKVEEPSHLVSIYYNMHMLWHSYYDYLLPLYQTLLLFSNNKTEFKNRRIFLPDFVPEIPQLTQSLSNYQIEKLKGPMCFNELTMGMVKITDLKLNKEDPPYSFCENCSFGLRDSVLNFFNITKRKKRKKINFVFLGRKSMTRRIMNEDEAFESIQKNLTSSEHSQIHYFELTPLKKQIEIVSKTDILIAVHGSGLANILFMKPGAAVIEIMPNGFTCRDWYMKAAKAAGVNYYAYYAKSQGETVGGNEIEAKKCQSNKKKCSSRKCIDILRDRNINLNIKQFNEEMNNFLKINHYIK